MAHSHNNLDKMNRAICMCCSREINLLSDHESVIHFLGEASARRRGSRCMICGQIACVACSGNGCRCTCDGNAWVALPYLERRTEKHAQTDPV